MGVMLLLLALIFSFKWATDVIICTFLGASKGPEKAFTRINRTEVSKYSN